MKSFWVKFLEFFLVTLATAAMIIVMLLTQDGNILGPISGSFVTIFSVFLGVDLGKMLKETNAKPPGDFEEMHFARYTYSIIIFFGLLVLSFVVKSRTGNEMTAAQSVFGSGSMIMISFFIGGLGGNKIFTGKSEKVEDVREDL